MIRRYLNPANAGPTANRYSHGIRVGDVIYVSGQVSLGRDGKIVGVGNINAQVARVFENLARVLEAEGATKDDVVTTTTYVTNVLFLPAVEEARKKAGLTNAPNTMIVVTSLASPDLLVAVKAVAVIGQKERIYPANIHDVTGRYVHAIRAGDTVYVAGQVAFDVAGNIVGRGDATAQVDKLFDNMGRVLEVAGASLADVVSTTTFATHIALRPAINEVRKRYCVTNAANATIVCAGLALPELLVEVTAVAYIGPHRESIFLTGFSQSGLSVPAVRAGDTLYIGGRVALGADGSLVGKGDIEEQATQVFDNLALVMASAGGKVDDVVSTTNYMTNWLYRPFVDNVLEAKGVTKLASTTAIIPSLVMPDLFLEIEGVAVLAR